MQNNQISSSKSRTLDLIVNLSIVLLILLFFGMLGFSAGKPKNVELPQWLNATLAGYFSLLSFLKAKDNERKPGNSIDIGTIVVCIAAIAFVIATFKQF